MSDQDNLKNINKLITTQLARRAGYAMLIGLKGIAGAILPAMLVLIIPVLLILFLAGLAYASVFLVPQMIVEENLASGKGKIVAIFNFGDNDMWTEEDDIILHQTYVSLSDTWKIGLDEYQKEQAEQYALPWAILAAVDRVVGDPSMTNDGSPITPRPYDHFEILKPEFEWRESIITRFYEWQEEEKYEVLVGFTKEMIPTPIYEERIRIVARNKHETETVKLLTKAVTFEAAYIYDYEQVTNVSGEPGLTTTRITETKEVISTVEEHGPYYQPLIMLLTDYGFMGKGILEFILELATVYDQDYKYNIEERWLTANSLALDLTQRFYHGSLGSIIWPLPNQYTNISSPFGNRIHPISLTPHFHPGIDLPAPAKTPVFSAADGYVRFSDFYGGYGKTVIIEHGDDYLTLYAHLSSIDVRVGDYVAVGDVIGKIGSTGRSTGNHLHFEVRRITNNELSYINPLSVY
jgi:murein DD-endopeptidase MepM/ murein hydrolase activator NlpD